ncbi:Membrane protein involved in the export of O-antigen and teichoic acid [Marinobacter sp. LV10R510-11A]|uniref:oligosaccharide flippase family protein n=1 Tax=Marinobacter sp. LV10R510-11A TaxID=1415568 RepID=UPI000BB69D6E|nr:oligosaccharide flippase family protein [Marinobacter sp. LV10R510-11A]SOB75153.1 Membrane protein involved in the export of O-antigen and teichoic acid [Marinobacter sp. LV10R510-11A]
MSTAKKLFQSSGLLVGIRFFQRSLGLISTLILARLLTPSDFGIVAVAALIIHFSEVLSNTGIQQYLVQSEDASEETVNTAWTLNLLLKVSVCVLLYLLLPGISWFYESPNIVFAVGALIPVILIRAIMNPELHVQRRNLNYGVIFKIGVIQKLISFLVVVVIALLTQSFWAIIAGDIVSSLVSVALSYYYCARRPGLSMRNASRQWGFSKWMLARGSLGYLRAQADTLLISQFYSLAQLGKFNIAREFTIMPANEIIKPAVEPLLAMFSSVRTDRQKMAQQVSLALLVISIFTAPFVAFIHQFYEPIVFYLLGKNWLEAAPLMQAMTPLLFAFALGGILNNVCFALAKVKIVFWYDAVSLILIFGTLLAAQGLALTSFIWLRSFIGLVAVIIFLYICSRLIRARFTTQIILLVTPLVASFAGASLAHLLIFQHSFLSLFLSGVVFVLCYGSVMFALAYFLSKSSSTWGYVYEYSLKLFRQLRKKNRTH